MIIGISGKKQHGKDTIANIIEYLTDEYFHHGQILNTFSEHQNRYSKLGVTPHWQTKKFADKLKDIVCLLIGCTRKQLEDNDFKEKELGVEWDYIEDTSEYGQRWIYPADFSKATSKDVTHNKMTPRKLLQLIGTDCGRNIIHPNIWVNATMSEYKDIVEEKRGDNLAWVNTPNWLITDVRFPNEVKAIKDRGGMVIRVSRPYSTVVGQGNGLQATFSQDQFHESEIALDNYKEFDCLISNEGSISSLIEMVETFLKHQKIIQ